MELNRDTIIEEAMSELNDMMDKWCHSYANNCSGGEMRSARGEDIETFVRNTINKIGHGLVAKRGNDNKTPLKVNVEGKEIIKQHQVDVHIYLNDVFIAVIECKAYLDSCYYVRACDDFKLFGKFGYNIPGYIFTLENSIDEDTRIFTDYVTDNSCKGIFYMLDGKRSSSKPIYNQHFRKQINKDKLIAFIDFILHSGNIVI